MTWSSTWRITAGSSGWRSRSPTICSTSSATSDTAGKTLGTDLEQQKLTLPIIRMLDAVPAPEAARLRQLLAEGGPHRREQIAAALAQTDAISYARQRAERFAAEASEELVVSAAIIVPRHSSIAAALGGAAGSVDRALAPKTPRRG